MTSSNKDTSVWKIDSNNFPSQGTMSEKIAFWLRYAILAPSAHNTQPWGYQIRDNVLDVYRDEEYTLKVGDPTLRETFISIGAFIENFVGATEAYGYQTQVKYVVRTVSDLKLASITVSKTNSDLKLNRIVLESILHRHTNRGSYDSTPLSKKIIKDLAVTTEDGVEAIIIADQNKRNRIAALVGEGTMIALSMNKMKNELKTLATTSKEKRTDGMSVQSLVENAPKTATGSEWVEKHLDAEKEGRSWNQNFSLCPLLIIIATELDSPELWLKAGRVMQRVLLIGTSHGLTHCISAAPIEIPTLVPKLRQEIKPTLRPQVLFRLGIPLNPEFSHPSARRPVIIEV